MNNGKRVFIGYHGTETEKAKSILKSRSFNTSHGEEEWLGIGVYFFQDDMKQAINFCTKARKYKNWSVLKATISAERVIDLIDINTFDKFQAYATELKSRFLKLKNGKKRQLMNSVILDVMYKLNPYDVVRAAFPIPKVGYAPRTNIQPMEIQLSVRNRNCIDRYSIKEVENDGCK
ncbi:hypothetical protein [Clostridium ljungdahlii]|uniref:DUF3990 domain-containing protein n=1 Tax=Clostridium ljungdahlii TaxID=1538 RepID=A0A170NKU5_9CLOT|nr:hypothetical protein [Clostridium ljungdahlii]OAA91284.1 hypothetical protein WY13_00849 [Clostridium ljungdahlii]